MTPEPAGADLLGKGMPQLAGHNQWEALQEQAAAQMAAAEPKTQKAKGIKVLQGAGILPASYATVCTTALQTRKAWEQGQRFFRPCPITPRHGFVDSVMCETAVDAANVFLAARKADPQAEVIAMPFIPATHNMVWRPGLLAIGPGHDGATAGHHSVSVFLQSGFPDTWRDWSTQAGVKLDSADPFIEAVVSPAHELVVTQIRAGVKGTVTEPDWNPYDGMVVGEVITLDGTTKPEPDAMLDWEEKAKTLTPGFHVVYDNGGNLGDHWAVHSQLNHVSVVTTFKPHVGQVLPKLGIDLPPLEPQAILFGFLGGIVRPSLLDQVSRKRGVCAALCGTHHGIRMGGDAGVFIGASVAAMLRLGQAAIWGEARHAGPSKLNRQQVFASVLDDWQSGRAGLKVKTLAMDKVRERKGNGYGGDPWKACGWALAELDGAMVTLAQVPTVENAGVVLAKLTNAINLAHNGNWWFDKFITVEWFDYAATLDPRVALMAGPVWYDSTTTPVAERLKVLRYLEQAEPVDFSKFPKPDMKLVKAKTPSSPLKTKATPSTPKPASVWTKEGSFGVVAQGDGLRHHGKTPVVALARVDGHTLHVQVGYTDHTYVSGNVTGFTGNLHALMHESLSGSGVPYTVLILGADYDVFALDGVLLLKGK